MSITKITDPLATPTNVTDYQAQNTHLDRLLGNIMQPFPIDGSNIKKGSLFNIGGDMFYTDADTAISGIPSDYVKLVVTGTDAAPSYVANLSGVTWNDAFNGYYSGLDLYVFDEAKAVYDGSLTSANGRLAVFAENAHMINANIKEDLIVGGDATISGYAVFDAKRITSANYFHASGNENDLFDKLAPFIPNNGNGMKLTGEFKISAGPVTIASVAERLSSTEINLRGGRADTGGVGVSTITNGSATTLLASLSW